MDVKEAIKKRRAYRALEPVEITEELIRDLADAANLAASCFNNQPWRFVFVHDKDVLAKMKGALSQGNEWARSASMMIIVFSKKEDDCIIKDREYFLFDTGMAVAHLVLRATELGLVAHPIAGYSPKKTRAILGIPEDMKVITLVIVGRKSADLSNLADDQIEIEKERPDRQPLGDFVYVNAYKQQILKE